MTGGVRTNSGALLQESIRSLRANLFIEARGGRKSFVVTSPRPGDGKSIIAGFLAKSLASVGKEVLLVDADFRRPSLHRIMRLSNETGFADVLSGTAEFARARQVVADHLSVLTNGTASRESQKLLEAGRLDPLLNEFENSYDIVLFDSAPLLAVADTELLASRVGAAILVLKHRESTQKEAVQAKERLESAGATVVGCVLNCFDAAHAAAPYPYVADYTAGHTSKSGARRWSVTLVIKFKAPRKG